MTVPDDPTPRSRVRDILHQAMDLPLDGRRAYIESRLPKGETLAEALDLLDEMQDLGDFLEKPSIALAFEPALPSRIGTYRVERLLGWGSMGVVYLSRQESPERRVAVKVLRVDASSPVMSRRFAQEGQVLARLSHPGIASVYEAGMADLGAGVQPFLAMEYVDGVPITKYAEANQLDERGCVELVAALARTVQHAHEKGVLHRDLKPENVLVRSGGEPCVLDFGVAHMTTDDAQHLTMTATGQVIGTLAYMAPEQARGASLDARVDQFALGAILYELLTGELPFDVRGRLPHESLRVIADGDCRPPTQFARTLSGDLEAILMTALAAEPVRRYATVEEFARDLERFLAGKPIHARPPSQLEVLVRFVRRHALVSAVVLVGLMALGAAIAWGANLLLTAERAESGIELFSDARLQLALESELEDLWPTSSATLPAFERWLESAAGLRERLPGHRALLERIAQEEPSAAARTEGMDSVWLRGEGREVVPAIERMLAELVPEMEARAEIARTLRQRTIDDHATAWTAAAARVAADERFGGYVLTPREGLVPLGPDPSSGLEEFVVHSSGVVPKREAETGSFIPHASHGLVLVMIPAGDVWIGAQSRDVDGIRYDSAAADYPGSSENEGPPFRVHLDPFMISKYEITQAQWTRLAGDNPSNWEVGATFYGKDIELTNPVETVTWEDSLLHLRRIGMTLPTEAQWETAALAGSALRYMVGDEYMDLEGYSNWKSAGTDGRTISLAPDDGYFTHRPVGQLLPNAYGLHDILGNVWEYCLDDYKVSYHLLEHREGDGLVISEPDGDVSRRGASSGGTPKTHRVWARSDKRTYAGDSLTGLRPAWSLEPVDRSGADEESPNSRLSSEPSHD